MMTKVEGKKEEVYASSPSAQCMARFTDDYGHILIPGMLEFSSFLSRRYFYMQD